MSLDSSFYLDAPRATPASAQALLLDTGHFTALDDLKGQKRLAASGCLLVIAPPSSPNFVLKDVGIDATLHFYFANTDKELLPDWTLSTLHAVMKLLHSYPGDALLLYSIGSPALLRRQANLILDSRCGLWKPDLGYRPLVDLPHRWGIITTD